MTVLNFAFPFFLSFFPAVAALANNPPLIHDLQSTLILSEDTPIGTVITTFRAEDRDGPQPLTLEPTTAETASLVNFTQTETTPTTITVDIILISQLDRDVPPAEKHLYFRVSDGSSQVTRHVTLFIIDVNDEVPVFHNLPYTMYLSEATPVGTEVYNKISATDPDKGLGGDITFSLEARRKGADGYIEIDENTGVVTLIKQLDYEYVTYYAFDLVAMDGYGLRSEVVPLLIFVQDVQDTPPVFIQYSTSVTINEEVPVGTKLQQVVAVDGDKGVPNNITYRLWNGTDKFVIDKLSGWITTSSRVDLEKLELSSGNVLTLGVTALEENGASQQHGNTSVEVVIYVTVSDVNDNPPQFVKCDNFSATVTEWNEGGEMITLPDGCNIHIIDKDQGDNGYFGVRLEVDGKPFDALNIIPSTAYSEGFFTLKVSPDEINNLPDVFTLTIVAQELSSIPGFSSRADLLVSVLKSNETITDSGPGLSIPILIAGVVGGLAFGVLCAVVAVCLYKYFKTEKDQFWGTRVTKNTNKIHPGDVTSVMNGTGPTLIQLPNDEKESK